MSRAHVHYVARAVVFASASLGLGRLACAQDRTPPPGGVIFIQSEADRAAEERINTALAQQVMWVFVDAPLEECVSYFSAELEIPIFLDRAELQEMGYDVEAPEITCTLEGHSAKVAIQLVLDDLNLRWIIVNEAMLITSASHAEGLDVIGVYEVSDLVFPDHSRAAADADFETVIEHITTHVSPELWLGGTGPGPINGLLVDEVAVLVISLNRPGHAEVAAQLATLRSDAEGAVPEVE